MNQLNFRKLSIILSVLALFLLIGGVFLIRSGITKASDSSIIVDLDRLPPSRDLQSGDQPESIMVPILTIPDNYPYHEYPLEDVVASPKYPVAQLEDVNKEMIQKASFSFNDQTESAEPEAIAYYVTSTIRYEMKDGTVYVSTTRLSPAAQRIPVSFSGNIIKLDNEIEAWMDLQIESETTPRAINYIEGDFIITVTGNVPENQLKELAAQVVLKE
jgi:hypothetical protein